jgi:hypothetical protein
MCVIEHVRSQREEQMGKLIMSFFLIFQKEKVEQISGDLLER